MLFTFVYREMFKQHLLSFSPTEKTRDELRVQVYDAMAEKNEDEQKKQTKADTGEEGDEEKKSQINESKADKSEDGTENEKEAEKEEAEGNFNAAGSTRGLRRSY